MMERDVDAGRAPDQKRGGRYRRSEFVLAMSIFVTMSIIGTAFGLWMVGMYNAKPAGQPPTVEGTAPVRQDPPPEAVRPDPPRPADQADQGVNR